MGSFLRGPSRPPTDGEKVLERLEQWRRQCIPWEPGPALALFRFEVTGCSLDATDDDEDGKEVLLVFLEDIVRIGTELND
jgi:hypothetical protein